MRFILVFALLLLSGSVKGQNLLNNTYSQVQQFYKSNPKHIGWEYDKEDNSVSFANKDAGVLYATYFTNNKVTTFKLVTYESMHKKVEEIYNSKYKKIGANIWVDYKTGIKYKLEVKDGLLYSTMTLL
jgi:hypothetical protein